jgi:hypothetical protein
MSNITIEQLESAFIKADNAGNTEDALAFANAIREYRAEASKPPEGVKDYEDVVPEEVKQKEKERLEAPPVSVNPMAAGGGALTRSLVQSSTDFLRYMGFGEYGQKKKEKRKYRGSFIDYSRSIQSCSLQNDEKP